MSLSSPESVECELGRSISLHRISLGYLPFCVSVCVCVEGVKVFCSCLCSLFLEFKIVPLF